MAYKRLKLPSELPRKKLLELSRELKADGRKLPKSGWCAKLKDGRELCHDRNGYFVVGHGNLRGRR